MNSLNHLVARWVNLALLLSCQFGTAQPCSHEALTAKYWQYRENLNKHFVMNDRKPNGCIGNGITRAEEDWTQLNCSSELLHGYGLPATSIWMAQTGAHGGMGDRNESSNPFYNPHCADYPADPNIDGTSNGNQQPGVPTKHNFLEYGSETPHQLGYYLVTLATEYELLRQSGQTTEMQRTLEDIFLALQAYRRLDITANCLVKSRYDEITAGFETENCDIWVGNHHYTEDACLCAEKYHNNQCKGSFSDAKWHFDIPCKENCPWPPNLSGFSGFFVRQDAVQEQEKLHDASEDRWNIDLVGGAFAMSQSPPCDPNFSPACYNEKHTNFLSQDQMFPILLGLAMVKRYIPPTATVTTCGGAVFSPYDIVQEITKGLDKLPDNDTRHIFWPASEEEDCCYKPVKFGECAGGNLQFSYAGIEYMYNYINEGNDDHNVGFWDRVKWGPNKKATRAFFAQAMSVGFDIASYGTKKARQKIIDACMDDKQEILLLMNDLLHPDPPNLMRAEEQEELKNRLAQMLCDAPCGGPCFKPNDYPNNDPSWPAFDCANTPNWIGQRWEGYGYPPPDMDAWNAREARQYNGLDFMALYNTFMLCFPEEQTQFYNPDRPESTPDGHLLGEDKILGASRLCPGQTHPYLLQSVYPAPSVLQDIVWESSSNISLSSTTSNPTTATAMSALTPSFIGVSFHETHEIQRNVVGIIGIVPFGNIDDQCDFSFRKPILTEDIANYAIVSDINDCQYFYWVHAEGPPLTSDTELYWTAENTSPPLFDHGTFIDGDGLFFNFELVMPPSHHPVSGVVHITLYAGAECNSTPTTFDYPYIICPPYQGRQIMISPNPGQYQIGIWITDNEAQDFVSTDPNGVRIQIYPSNGGTTAMLDNYLYSNGQYFNVAALSNGVYQVRASAADLTPIQANLVILR